MNNSTNESHNYCSDLGQVVTTQWGDDTGGSSKLCFFTLEQRCWSQKGWGDLWEGVRKDNGRSDCQHHNSKGGQEEAAQGQLKAGASSCALYSPGACEQAPAGWSVGRGLHSIRGWGLKIWSHFLFQGYKWEATQGKCLPLWEDAVLQTQFW